MSESDDNLPVVATRKELRDKTKPKRKRVRRQEIRKSSAERKSLVDRRAVNNADRADAMRAKLSDAQHLKHAHDALNRITKMGVKYSKVPRSRFTADLKRKIDANLAIEKANLEYRLKFINKLLPDLRSTGFGDDDDSLPELTLRVVRGKDDDSD